MTVLPDRLRAGARRAVRRARRVRHDLALAGLAGVAGVAGSFAASGLTPTFLASPVERTLSRSMPGVVVATVIERLGSLGQQLNMLLAIALSVVALGALAFLALRTGRGLRNRIVAPVVAAVGAWLVAVLLTGAPVLSAGAGVPAGATLAVAELFAVGAGGDGTSDGRPAETGRRGAAETAPGGAPSDDAVEATDDGPGDDRGGASGLSRDLTPGVGVDVGTPDAGGDATGAARTDADENVAVPAARRRQVLGSALSVAGFVAASYVVGDRRTPSIRGEIASGGQRDPRAMLSAAAERSFDLGGMEPLVSEDFYQVDINAVDPAVEVDDWSLSVTGAVEDELTLTRRDLQSMRTHHRFVTLRCVGDPLNGKKMDTALWTGTPASRVLDRANPGSDCGCVMLRAADGYYEEFPLAALRAGLLAYGMNAEVLPRGHGYPVRALVPGHWGEVNLKWLTEIEVLEREAKGYWEKRGWHGTGPVTTVAKLHHVDRGDGRVRVGGHAYAGTRGVRRVEVSTDGGDSWQRARLSDPLPGVVDAGGGTPTGTGTPNGTDTGTPATTGTPTDTGTPTTTGAPTDTGTPATSGTPTDTDGSTGGGGTPTDSPATGDGTVAMDAWRQWTVAYDDPGDHEVVVRAVDGTGTVQPSEQSGAFPEGASGWVRRDIG
jgi:DMSO/TMAO reductase YedYZ molybdopterin-dependent catalytic subunit